MTRKTFEAFVIGICALFLALIFGATAHCQSCVTSSQVTLTGTIRVSNGLPVANGVITFRPSQAGFIAGCGVNLPVTAECATSTDGSLVEMQNPVDGPNLTTLGSGTLPAGVYYVVIQWVDALSHVTLPSPESRQTLSGAGSLVVNPSGGIPANATGMQVFIGTSSGGEQLQGTITPASAAFTQSSALISGAAPSTSNNTVCVQTANDTIWPVGTGYIVSMVDSDGNAMPGFPMQWQLLGAGTTINLANGWPYYNGVVTYMTPIWAQPQNHGQQSISGPLSMSGYNVTSVGKLGVQTATPGYGVDVEGSGGTNSAINALQGYLVNGAAGTSGQALCSDGTFYDLACTIPTIPTIYYQHIIRGSTLPQEPAINFTARFQAIDVPSTSTQVDLNGTGSEAKAVTATAAGVSGNCMVWNASGGAGDAGSPCGGPLTPKTCNSNGCYRIWPDGTIEEWGQSANAPGSGSAVSLAITFPHAFTSTTHLQVVVSPTISPGGDGNPHPLDCHLDAAPSTSGATAILAIPTQIGGSGYASPILSTQYCSWHAWGD